MNVSSLAVSVDMDVAICEMFDIRQDLHELVSLVPCSKQLHADALKGKILDEMVGWIDGGKEDNQA